LGGLPSGSIHSELFEWCRTCVWWVIWGSCTSFGRTVWFHLYSTLTESVWRSCSDRKYVWGIFQRSLRKYVWGLFQRSYRGHVWGFYYRSFRRRFVWFNYPIYNAIRFCRGDVRINRYSVWRSVWINHHSCSFWRSVRFFHHTTGDRRNVWIYNTFNRYVWCISGPRPNRWSLWILPSG
jgi:hypothetical protein